MDWQAELTAEIADAIGKILSGPFGYEERPDYATVIRALEDARIEARTQYVDALAEACRFYGVEPVQGRTPGIVPGDSQWQFHDGNDEGEESQLRAFGETPMDAIHALHIAILDRFE